MRYSISLALMVICPFLAIAQEPVVSENGKYLLSYKELFNSWKDKSQLEITIQEGEEKSVEIFPLNIEERNIELRGAVIFNNEHVIILWRKYSIGKAEAFSRLEGANAYENIIYHFDPRTRTLSEKLISKPGGQVFSPRIVEDNKAGNVTMVGFYNDAYKGNAPQEKAAGIYSVVYTLGAKELSNETFLPFGHDTADNKPRELPSMMSDTLIRFRDGQLAFVGHMTSLHREQSHSQQALFYQTEGYAFIISDNKIIKETVLKRHSFNLADIYAHYDTDRNLVILYYSNVLSFVPKSKDQYYDFIKVPASGVSKYGYTREDINPDVVHAVELSADGSVKKGTLELPDETFANMVMGMRELKHKALLFGYIYTNESGKPMFLQGRFWILPYKVELSSPPAPFELPVKLD